MAPPHTTKAVNKHCEQAKAVIKRSGIVKVRVETKGVQILRSSVNIGWQSNRSTVRQMETKYNFSKVPLVICLASYNYKELEAVLHGQRSPMT